MKRGSFLLEKMRAIGRLDWGIILVLSAIFSLGLMMLFSASGGAWMPWALPQLVRFGVGLCLMVVMATTSVRLWYHLAYLIYGVSLILLIAVEVIGAVGMGAQRWIKLGFFNLQPSELMKISLIIVLARLLSEIKEDHLNQPKILFVPCLLIFVPVLLVLKEPDLGTGLLLLLIGASLLFLRGVRILYFGIVGVCGASALPLVWQFLRGYQKERIMTFWNPERDPLGAGYHIVQSKIALGSGGLFGKGLMEGTQSRLNFLPEKQTDFIFTMFGEEFGFVGALFLLLLYGVLFYQTLRISMDARTLFGRLLSLGIATMLLIYVFINTAMVMGLVPVVGVPLPLVSYGGTSLLTLMMAFGLLLGVDLDRRYGRHRS